MTKQSRNCKIGNWYFFSMLLWCLLLFFCCQAVPWGRPVSGFPVLNISRPPRPRARCSADLDVWMGRLRWPKETYGSVCGRPRYVKAKYRPSYLCRRESSRGLESVMEPRRWYNVRGVCSALYSLAPALLNIPACEPSDLQSSTNMSAVIFLGGFFTTINK